MHKNSYTGWEQLTKRNDNKRGKKCIDEKTFLLNVWNDDFKTIQHTSRWNERAQERDREREIKRINKVYNFFPTAAAPSLYYTASTVILLVTVVTMTVCIAILSSLPVFAHKSFEKNWMNCNVHIAVDSCVFCVRACVRVYLWFIFPEFCLHFLFFLWLIFLTSKLTTAIHPPLDHHPRTSKPTLAHWQPCVVFV